MSQLGVLAQSIEMPIRRGEAATLTFTGTFASTPAAWEVELWIRLHPAADWTVIDDIDAPTVTGSYTAVWSVPLTADDTAGLDAGLNEFQLRRVDAGDETALSAGTLLVLN